MRRAAARSVVVALAVSSASCSGRNTNADSAVQADRAAATVDTSGGGAPTAEMTPPATSTGGRPPSTGASNATSIRPSATADTLRGIVKVVGSAINEQAVIRPNGGGAMVALSGPESQTLKRLSGTDVWVSGTRQGPRAMNVDRFLVRSVSGVPAMDGTLMTQDGALAITITGEHTSHPITNPPTALRAHVGHRVWITGPLETGAVTFGLISDR